MKLLQFGGHCDGDIDVLTSTIREWLKESGLTISPYAFEEIVDIDIHEIPDNIGLAGTIHMDTAYSADENEVDTTQAFGGIKWCSFEEMEGLVWARIIRYFQKARLLCLATPSSQISTIG